MLTFPVWNAQLSASWLSPKGWLLLQEDVRRQRGIPNRE